jgi:hypothetical protein
LMISNGSSASRPWSSTPQKNSRRCSADPRRQTATGP